MVAALTFYFLSNPHSRTLRHSVLKTPPTVRNVPPLGVPVVTRPMRSLPHPQGLLLPLGSPDVPPARASLISEQSSSCIVTSLQLSGLDKSPHVLTCKASGCPVSPGVSLTPQEKPGGPSWPGVSPPPSPGRYLRSSSLIPVKVT